jgi:hypothetical protein
LRAARLRDEEAKTHQELAQVSFVCVDLHRQGQNPLCAGDLST